MNDFGIFGAGAWGTALALHLARLDQTVHIWGHNPDQMRQMKSENTNRFYLPDFPFPDNLIAHETLESTVPLSGDILIAVPSFAFRKTLTQLKPLLKPGARIAWGTKGLEPNTGRLLSEVCLEVFGPDQIFAILSGPSFASEVARGLPTAVVIASNDEAFDKSLSQRFNSDRFRTYLSKDIVGVQLGGATKNILAVASGICDGMQLGANARSALITRGLSEMTRLGVRMGAELTTFLGLAGVGDLILTCTDDQSRNRRFGLELGAGKTIQEAQADLGGVAEGFHAAIQVKHLAERFGIAMPITETLQLLMNGKVTAVEAMNQLLSRKSTKEWTN